jgi:CheY-like chemotaxis protein
MNIRKGKGRILIMDDEADVRDTTGKVLARLGYEVRGAMDGTEAIAMFEEAKESGTPYDLVIMDLTIPGGMGGLEAIGKLREIEPRVKAIVSSGGSEQVMSDFLRYGFAGVINKPYRLQDLSEEVYKVLMQQA